MSDNESCRNHVSTDNGGAVDREHPKSMCGNLAIGESSAKSADCVERLYKRLAICESTINQLFTTRKSGSILKEKLIAVDELILDIPSQDTQLAAEWREKVANWWTQFAAAVEPSNAAAAAGNSDGTAAESSGNPQQDKRQPMQNRPPMNSTFGPNGSRTFFSNSRFQPNFRPNMPPHHHDGGSGGGGAGAAAAREARESTRRKFASVEEYNAERDKVRSQLCAEFENVKPLESGQSFDIDSLKRLNLVVRMARNLTHPFDAALKEEMFCHGYRKLTAEKREKFLEQYGSNRMLLNLAIFLRQQVDSCFQDLEIFKSLDGRGRSFRRFPKFAANLSQPQAPRAPQPNESVSNLASTSAAAAPDSIASIDANNNEAGTESPGTTTATGSPDAGGDSGINSTTTNAVNANQISKPSISAVNRGRREYGGKVANYGGNGGPRRSYTKICFNCKRPGHLSKFCKSQKATMIAGFNVSANCATITTTTSNDAAEGEAAVSAEAGVEAPNCSSGDSEKIAISGGGAKDDNNSGNNNRDEDDDLGFAITTDSEVTTA